jgi:hypothetical protein
MVMTNDAMLPQMKALKTTDLGPLIRISGLMLPRLLNGFLPCLDKKQRSAFDKVMPEGGEKQIYLQVVGTPTPPIVIGMTQPLRMGTLSENEVRQQQIRGIRLAVEDLQLLAGGRTLGNTLKLFWHLKGQVFTILSISGMFMPFLWLGSGEIKDMRKKMTTHFKPLLDLMPGSRK